MFSKLLGIVFFFVFVYLDEWVVLGFYDMVGIGYIELFMFEDN